MDREDRPGLYRAYLLKEGLRTVFKLPADQAPKRSTDGSPGHADSASNRFESFVRLQRRIVHYGAEILSSIEHGLSNRLVESVNTKIRLIVRMAFGFAGPTPSSHSRCSILGGHRPTLPGRR
ncbi:hypothetical protein GCM10022237_06220 [Nocardioides ginsengisoli]